MLPLLKLASDEKEHYIREAIDKLAETLHISEGERKELLPSGKQAVFDNRAGWARTYMAKAGLLENTRRGYFRITQRGLEVLQQNPAEINTDFLSQFPEFREFKSIRKSESDEKDESEELANKTPEEILELAYQKMRDDLTDKLLNTIKTCSPSFFERLVIDLLLNMGYGGTRKDAGKAIGKTGDGGIDGIIKEDRFGLDIIYIQAKRWEASVGRPEIQKFAGALQGQRARKGIFITTSNFTKEAEQYVSNIDSKIILIDGDYLAQLMIDHNVGVHTSSSYEIKGIDSDYFTEE